MNWTDSPSALLVSMGPGTNIWPLQVNLRHPEIAWGVPSFWLDYGIQSFACNKNWGQNQPRSQGKALTNPGSASKKPGGYWILAEQKLLPSKTISWTLEEISRENKIKESMMRPLGTWGLEDLSPWKVPMLSFPPKLWRLGSLGGKGSCDNMHIQCVCRVHLCGYEVVIVKKHGTFQSYLHIFKYKIIFIKTYINNIYVYIYIYISDISTLRFSDVECIGLTFHRSVWLIIVPILLVPNLGKTVNVHT